jgi:hypothetical protein
MSKFSIKNQQMKKCIVIYLIPVFVFTATCYIAVAIWMLETELQELEFLYEEVKKEREHINELINELDARDKKLK